MKQLHHILDASFLIYLAVFLETPGTKQHGTKIAKIIFISRFSPCQSIQEKGSQ